MNMTLCRKLQTAGLPRVVDLFPRGHPPFKMFIPGIRNPPGGVGARGGRAHIGTMTLCAPAVTPQSVLPVMSSAVVTFHGIARVCVPEHGAA